jgi:hypothetical protein
MFVKAHKLNNVTLDDYEAHVLGRWTWDQLRADPRYRNWSSFCRLVWDPGAELLYCGVATLSNDIFWTFNPQDGSFRSLGYPAFGDRFDAKFHRSLERDSDGTFIAATALLHDPDHFAEAPGGKLLRYNPLSGEYNLLAIPVPHQYIQSLAFDRVRRILYGFTFPAEQVFRYDLQTGTCRILAYIGAGYVMAQGEQHIVDHQGRLWATWAQIRAWEDAPGPAECLKLFCYDPASDQITYFQHGLPNLRGDGACKWDGGCLQASDGMLYIGTAEGGLCRLNPGTAEVALLGKPCPGGRLTGLVQAADGRLIGVGGDHHQVHLFAYDLEIGAFEDCGTVFDPQTGESPERIHDLALAAGGVLFAGENDNPRRSGYLWECRL